MIKRLLIASFFFAPVAWAAPIETRFISVTPTVETSAYASGDAVGELQTISAACKFTTNTAELRGITIVDKAAQGIDVDLVLFSANPSATTVTDNSALDIADADLDKVTAVIPLTTHKAFADNGVTQAKNISYLVKCEPSTTGGMGRLYGVVVARGAITYAATSDVTWILELFAD